MGQADSSGHKCRSAPPKIKPCLPHCGNDEGQSGGAYQDARYGKGKRVHNPVQQGTEVGYKCTVCGRKS